MSDSPEIARLDGETEQAWAALVAYCELGPGRTYPATAEVLKHPPSYASQLKKWAKKWRWRERADRWDSAELEAGRGRRAKEAERARQPYFDHAKEMTSVVLDLARGKHEPDARPSVQLQAAIHALALAGMVAPKRTELVVEQDDGLGAAREALSGLDLAQLEAILSIEAPEPEGADDAG